MCRKLRAFRVACVTACLITVPWTHAFGRERHDSAVEPAQAPPVAVLEHQSTGPGTPGILKSLRNVTFEPHGASAPFSTLPGGSALQQRGRQSVATTTESKMLLGIVAGSMIVGGMALMAYGATSTCKGSEGASTSACDKKAVIGALSFSGGVAMLVLWALSR